MVEVADENADVRVVALNAAVAEVVVQDTVVAADDQGIDVRDVVVADVQDAVVLVEVDQGDVVEEVEDLEN